MKVHRAAIAMLALAGACRHAAEPAEQERARPLAAVRISDCEGPTRSLAPEAAALGARVGAIGSDSLNYALARTVPGGYAGIMEEQGRPILMLTRPEEAEAAKAALAPILGPRTGGLFDVASAEVRQVRWDYAQLIEWWGWLMQQPIWQRGDWVAGDKDEAANRVRFGVRDEAAVARVAAAMTALDLPCDLVLIEVMEVPVTLPGRPASAAP